MNRFYCFTLMLVAGIMTITFAACGGGDDDNGGSGSGYGGGTPTANINIIGTWRAYYQNYGVQVYDLVSFNADHTGYIIEEVGNGTDYKNPITWTMTGNVITVKLDGDYVITWTIQQIIDNNNVTISDGKRTYNVVRDGTEGGGGSSDSGGSSGDSSGGSSGGSGGGSSKTKCTTCNGSGVCEAPNLGYIANKQYCWGNKKCRPCGGSGQQKNVITGDYYACTYCNRQINDYYSDGLCGKCGGTGKCKKCGGDGYK